MMANHSKGTKEGKKVLVAVLKKKGAYSREILDQFKLPHDVLIYKNNIYFDQFQNKIGIRANERIIDLIFNTIFYLPFFILLFGCTRLREYDTLYIPMGGVWDIFFIILFKLFRKKVIFTIHDSLPHMGVAYIRLLNFSKKFSFKYSDYSIFLTEHQRDISFEYSTAIAGKSKVIPHGLISVEGIVPKSVSGSRKILFFGNIIKYKGVEMLAEACVNISDSIDQLVIAGKANYKVLLPKHDKIIFKNYFLSEKELAQEINECDILVLPYLEATQSGVLSIGIYSEKPMICTKVGGLMEQISDDECVFIEPNVATLQAAIKGLVEDESKRLELQKALKLKKMDLHWSNISAQIESLIKELREDP